MFNNKVLIISKYAVSAMDANSIAVEQTTCREDRANVIYRGPRLDTEDFTLDELTNMAEKLDYLIWQKKFDNTAARSEPVFIPKPDFVGLDKCYVKEVIYNAPFLDAEQKLRLFMLLQI